MPDIAKLKVNNKTYDIKDSVSRDNIDNLTNDLNNNYTKTSDLSEVALTGSYNDLSNKPTIPTKTSDLTNDSGYITKSVDDLTNYTKTSDLSTVATTGSYNDLTNKPTIPTKTSDLTNDSNFATTTYVDNSISPINQNLNGNPTISDKDISITLSNTLNAPMELDLYGNTSQTGTPTPSSPQSINVVTGNNTITIKNNDNTQSQSYPINLGNIELCKIGDYQDNIFYNTTDTNLDLNSWYIKKAIGKVVLNGTEDWTTQWNETSNKAYRTNISNAVFPTSSDTHILMYSNYYKSYSSNDLYRHYTNGISMRANNSQIIIKNNDLTTVTNFKTWLSTHNTIVYYSLSTPTYTKITDTTLINQLNALEKAMSYDTETNITQTNADKPFIINAIAFLNNQNGRYNYLNKKTDYIVENENLIL